MSPRSRLHPEAWAAMERDYEIERLGREAAGLDEPDFDDSSDSVLGRAVLDLSKIRAAPVRWLWPGRIPLGRITLLDGDPGLGKSTLLLDVAARLTTGHPMPNEPANQEPEARRVAAPQGRRVAAPQGRSQKTGTRRGATPRARNEEPAAAIILSAEDGLAETIRPRLEAAGADLSRVVAIPYLPSQVGERLITLPKDLATVMSLAQESGACLLVVDPFIAFLDHRVSPNDDQRLRQALAPLVLMAEALDLAVVLVRHLIKANTRNALHVGRGTVGLIGLARAGLLVAADPADPSGARRVLAVTKSNLAAAPPSLAYRLVTAPNGASAVEWEGPISYRADDLVARRSEHEPAQSAALLEATAILTSILADGPLTANDVRRQATQAGLGPGILWKAKRALGIQSYKLGQPGQSPQSWVWSLPQQGTLDAEDFRTPLSQKPDNLP